jgi:Protein of unknown function (DUF1524).
LITSANRRLGNKSFEEKKKTYEESELILTKGLAKFDQWNRHAVNDRQESMAKLAVASWRFD